jgi:Ras-related protein Rab-1A
MSTQAHDFLYKFLLIGDTGVGKSTMMLKICDGVFTDSHISTIGVDFKIKTIELNGKLCKLQIWDTAGQERFRVITSSYYRGSHGIFICFDLADNDTFENLSIWRKEIEKYTDISKLVCILIGMKQDIKTRAVSYATAKGYADQNGWDYVELSTKNESPDDLEQKVFIRMIDLIRTNLDPATGHVSTKSPYSEVTTTPKKSTSCCVIS